MSLKNLDKFSGQFSNVVRPKAFQRTNDFDDVRGVCSYWESVRRDASVPYRRDIDARSLGAHIGSCMILDRICDDNASIRLAGHHVQGLVGFEITNLPLSVLFSQESKLRAREMMKSMFSHQSPQFLDVTSERKFLKPCLNARMAFLPLLDMTGACTQALGVVCVSGGVKRPPYRFEITSLRSEQVSNSGLSSGDKNFNSESTTIKGAYLKVVK